MNMPIRWTAMAALALTTSLTAQSTLIVDGGLNGGFVTIQAAVQAAVDGDTILVQPTGGSAIDWTLTLSKAITLQGDFPVGRAPVIGDLTITGLRPGQQVVVRSLQRNIANNLGAGIIVRNCAARVVIEDCGLAGTDLNNVPRSPGLLAVNAAQVHIHRSNSTGTRGLRADASVITISDSIISGVSQFIQTSLPVTEALEATNQSSIWISGSRVIGGAAIDPFGIRTARSIILRSSTVTLAACDLRGFPNLSPGLDLDAGSSARVDVATETGIIVGAPANVAPVETGAISNIFSPATQSSQLTMNSAAGTIGVLAIALPGRETQTPFGSAFMLQPTIAVLGIGAMQVTATVPLPAGLPRGFMFTVQGVVLDQGQANLSTPVVATLRD